MTAWWGRRPAAWWGALGLLWLPAACSLLFWVRTHTDEHNCLADAWRIAQGEAMYRDFWAFSGPVYFWLTAASFWWTGPSLVVARCLALAVMSLQAWAVARLARALGAGPWLELGAVGLVLWGVWPVYRAHYHHHLAWALALVGLWACWSSEVAPGRAPWRAALALGAMVLSAFTTLTVGLPWLVAWACVRGLGWVRGRRAENLRWECLGGGVTLGAILGAMAATSSLGPWWKLSILWPLAHYQAGSGINHVPAFSDLEAWFPLWRQAMPHPFWLLRNLQRLGMGLVHLGAWLALPAMAAVAWRSWRNNQAWGARSWWALQLTLAASLTSIAAWRGRADLTHLTWAALPMLPLLVGVVQAHFDLVRPAARHHPLSGLLAWWPALAVAAGVTLGLAVEARSAWLAYKQGAWAWSLDRVYGQSEVVKAVHRWGGPGARLMVFPVNGTPFLYTEAKPSGPLTYLSPQSWNYMGPEEYRLFQRHWSESPPDLVLMPTSMEATAVSEWGGQPDLKAYAVVARPKAYPGEDGTYSLWKRR